MLVKEIPRAVLEDGLAGKLAPVSPFKIVIEIAGKLRKARVRNGASDTFIQSTA